MVPVTKKIIGCDCFQGDMLPGAQEMEEIRDETFVFLESRFGYRTLFIFKPTIQPLTDRERFGLLTRQSVISLLENDPYLFATGKQPVGTERFGLLPRIGNDLRLRFIGLASAPLQLPAISGSVTGNPVF